MSLMSYGSLIQGVTIPLILRNSHSHYKSNCAKNIKKKSGVLDGFSAALEGLTQIAIGILTIVNAVHTSNLAKENLPSLTDHTIVDVTFGVSLTTSISGIISGGIRIGGLFHQLCVSDEEYSSVKNR